MSTDEGQRGKQCNYKYLDPTVVLEKDKELELPLMNTSTKSSTAFFLWHIIKQINIIFKTHQNKQTKRISKRKKPTKNKAQQFQSDMHFWKQEIWMKHHHKFSSCSNTKRENRHKGEKNTITVPQCNATVRQSVKMRPISAYTLTSNQTLTLLKIWKRVPKYKEKGKEICKPQKQNVFLFLIQSSINSTVFF